MSDFQAQVAAVLARIEDPHTGTDLATSGALKGAVQEGGRGLVDLVLPYASRGWHETVRSRVQQALAGAGIGNVQVGVDQRVVAHQVREGLTPLPEVRNIIAVASGKGGVGKSTTSVNLALALAAEGARVGVLDADIYGPSVPRMLGVSGRPDSRDGKRIIPKESHGLQCMSIGFMIEEDTPMIWRGPMVTQALQQMLGETDWQDLDYLVIDLPPGTGDIQLTLSQKVPVAGSVIVTTPQDISLIDARKALRMFEKVEVPVLGIVENMSTHVCGRCGHVEPIFGEGGGEQMAADYKVPLLGQLPLSMAIREQADSGRPTVVAQPDSEAAAAYRHIARSAAGRLSRRPRSKAIGLPGLVIE